MSEELKPCPFCGAVDRQLVQAFTRATDTLAFWSVECLSCGAEVADDASQAAANAHWNMRAPAEALSFASSAAGQREGWSDPIVAQQRAEWEADVDRIRGSDLDSRRLRLSRFLRGFHGAYAYTRCSPAGDLDALLASPSAPEERRDEVEPRYLADRFEWAAPGDQQEDAWIVRFCDNDVRDMLFTGADAEREAWAAWERHAPGYNMFVFRLAALTPVPGGW